MQFEPGIDRHVWESRWASLEEDLETDPADVLPDLADLVQEMLVEGGYDVTDPVARQGEEREVIAEYLAVRAVADDVRQGEDVDPGDVADAIDGLYTLRDYVTEDGGS